MSDEEKNTVDDHIDVLLMEGESVNRQEFLDKLEEIYNQNSHKAYDSYNVCLVKNKQLGGWVLFFDGTRDEIKAETDKREAENKAKRKVIEAAELKEYLRLKKKYGKPGA